MSEYTGFTLQVIDIVDNPDGSATINFDVPDEFIAWFKEDQGLKRWSQKRFQKWAIEGIENYISLQEQKMNENTNFALQVANLSLINGSMGGYSSVGRASSLQGECQRFNSAYLHKFYAPVAQWIRATDF